MDSAKSLLKFFLRDVVVGMMHCHSFQNLLRVWKYLSLGILAPCVMSSLVLAQLPTTDDLSGAKKLGNTFADVFDRVAPAVVVIEAQRTNDTDTALRGRFNRFFGLPPSVDPGGARAMVEGSGFLIRSDGYILTNDHVLEEIDPGSLIVKMKDGKKFHAQVVGRDDKSDLALLKIDGENFPSLEFGDSDQVRIGEFALAIGAPYNLPYSLTAGIISGKGRTALTHGATDYEDYLQTDASINPGNSGGPLCDLEGKVIGINTVIYGLNRGLGFAIPSNMARDIADQLMKNKRVSRAWLGISIETLEESLRSQLGFQSKEDPAYGVVVQGVIPDTPASRSDLRPTDIITRVDNVDVVSAGDLQKQIVSKKVGQDVQLNVWRRGKFIQVSIRTEERPSSRPSLTFVSPQTPPSLESQKPFGLQLQTLTPELAQKLGLQTDEGVVVTAIDPQSPAQWAEIRVGDVITRVGDDPVATSEEVYRALQNQSGRNGVVLFLQRGDLKTYSILK